MRALLALAAGVTLGLPATAIAQTRLPRVYVGISGGAQASDNKVRQSFTVKKNVEDAPISVGIDEKRGILFDGGVIVRVAGRFGAGLAASVMTHDTDADVTASVPHPFFFRQPRSVEGTTRATRRETAGHIQAAYIIPGRLTWTIVGGPSIFSVRQTLVTDITYTDSYPFDTATFSSAQTTKPASKTAVGFNVGVDIAWQLSRHAGVGGLVRFARAEPKVDVNNATLKLDAGGLHAGAGLRLTF